MWQESFKVELTDKEIRDMMVRYHFRETDFFVLQRIYESILPLVKVTAYVDLVRTKEERLKYPWIDKELYAVVVMTLSDRIDRMQELYLEVEEVLTAYQMDCVALEIMRKGYCMLDLKIRESKALYPVRYDFLGEKYPLSLGMELLKQIDGCPVRMNESGQLFPLKSAIYVLQLSDKPRHGDLNICEYCKEKDTCLFRKQPDSGCRGEEKGMVHLYSGDGKGKTTAAIGLAVRALGAGRKVCFAQFLKGSRTSELEILGQLNGLTILRNEKDYGFYSNMADKERARVRKMHDDTLDEIRQMVIKGQIDMLILDEITHVYRLGAINRKKVQELLNTRPAHMEIVMTGRDPDAFFVDIADYHTEMTKKKHPFEQGIPAREGIEF